MGTTLHIVDPKAPGAVDLIINLGDYWDEEKVRIYKDEIIATSISISQHFKRAYRYLAAAKIYRDAERCYYANEAALDTVKLNAAGKDVIDKALGSFIGSKTAVARHLFASSITPQGPVNHIDSIFGGVKKKVLIQGDPGTGKSTILKRLVDEAVSRNIDMEVYHCALEPEKIEHVLFPQLDVGVVTSSKPHFYRSGSKDLVFDTGEYVLGEKLTAYGDDMALARDNFNAAIEQAVKYIARAKELHDDLEGFYVPHMDFKAIDRLKGEILKEILG